MNVFKLKSHIGTVVFCLFFCLCSFGQQNIQVDVLTAEDGLSQGMINDILQDRDGFLWIATKDGLNRFDGYEFKIFTNDPNNPRSISNNHIVKLFEDSAGRIWATTNTSGINILDKETGHFHHLRHDPKDPTSLTGNFISDIVEDTSGYFIVTIDWEEINMFQLDKTFFDREQSPQVIRVTMRQEKKHTIRTKDEFNLAYRKLRGIVKDAKHRIWVSGHNTIYQLNVQTTELETVLEEYHFDNASPDSNESIWGSSYNSLIFKWDGVKVKDFKIDNPSGDILEDIEVINDSTLFAITKNKFYQFDTRKLPPETSDTPNLIVHDTYSLVPKNENLTLDHPLKSMTIDRSGIFWFGTNGYGIFKMNPNRKRFSHKSPGLSIRNIITNPAGETLLQDYGQQWFNPDKTCFTGVKMQTWINECAIGDILVSKSGDYWLSYLSYKSNGVDYYWTKGVDLDRFYLMKRYNPFSKQSQTYPISWHHSDSQPIIESKDGSIWMAGYNDVLSQLDPISGDVLSYDIKSGDQINVNEGKEVGYFSEDISTALYEDSDGAIWVGTERGITKCIQALKGSRLQVKQFKNIPHNQNSLSYNHVTCFLEDPVDPDHFLWVSTKGGGLNRLDKKTGTFKHLTKNDGLPDNVIYGILADDNDNLWGSTNKGIFCMSANKDIGGVDQKEYVFRNFSKTDGLQDNEFNTGAYAKKPNGKLAFGGINGFNSFDPKEVLSEKFKPSIYITNILVNNQSVSPNDKSGVIETSVENTKKISLNPEHNILTLEFASLDFNAPERNKYRYQLTGADDTWVEAENRRSATFLNLQPNDYIFRVQGSNSQGIWSDQFAELEINVLPPLWKTWWAYLGYMILTVCGIVAYFRYSMNRSKLQQQLEYEKRETERVKDLDALKTQLYMNMTHEFRTPLTIIIGMAKQVQDNPKEHFTSGLNMITRNGQNLLNLINKMLNLSKLESGKMTLDLVHGDIVLFLRNMVESFHSYAANKEIRLHFLPEVDAVQMDFDADKLQQVISNLISNAFKFTPEGGHIYFYVRKENSSLVIRVKDTGKGISQDDLEKVFERFYQADTSTTRQYEGSGIGLALSKELVTLMNGEISALSPPVGLRKGTEFKVILPIENAIEIKEIENIKIKKPEFSNKRFENVQVNGNGSNLKSIDTDPNLVAIEDVKKSKPLILLVEDNEDVAAYIASCLPDEYRLVIAENGQEGLELAIELIPDLIISDVMMPVMDGFEFCRKLKANNLIEHIPVIILSARADIDSKLEGLEIGANAYLPKPFEKQELLFTLKNMFKLRDKLRIHYQNVGGLSEIEKEDVVTQETKPEDEFVLKIRGFIEEHIDNFDLNVDLLAKEMHLSHSQLGRKLDALTGFSPSRFIRFVRLKYAKELLQNPDLSITVVAYESGFSDPSYFTRVFKKEFGVSPVQWRKDSVAN